MNVGAPLVGARSCPLLIGPGRATTRVASTPIPVKTVKTGLTLGVHSLFNTVPDENTVGQSRSGQLEGSAGNLIIDSPGIFVFSRRSAPFGFNGGFLYARYSVR